MAAKSESASLFAEAWDLIPGGINSARRRTNPPIAVKRSDGSRLIDLDGREIIDYHQAYSAVILGYSHPEITDRVSAAISELVLVGLGVTEGEVELARRLVGLIPSAEQVALSNSGSEATYNAIRLARGVTGREKILKFAGCYHGSHDYVLRNAHWRSPAATEEEYGGVLRAASEPTIVCHYNDLDDVAAALDANPSEVAAIIVEPIAHNAPNILPADGFLAGLRDLADRHGAILIFDEVITGFRHALSGYQSICGVTPDLTTVGKALANGFPIAALVGPRELMSRFATHPDGDVFYAGTYNGNNAAVAAALACLDVLETERVHDHIYRLGQRMRDGLSQIATDAGIPHRVTGYGSIYTLLFIDGPLRDVRDLQRADTRLFVSYREQLLARGAFEMAVPFVRAQVGFGHTDADVDHTLELARDALAAALDQTTGR